MLTPQQLFEIKQAMESEDTPITQKTVELHLLKQIAHNSGIPMTDERANETLKAAIRSEIRMINDQIFTVEEQCYRLKRERAALVERLRSYN